jgi:hypothetical protein
VSIAYRVHFAIQNRISILQLQKNTMSHKTIGNIVILALIAANITDDLIRVLKHDNNNPMISRNGRIRMLIINIILLILFCWAVYA